MFSSSYSQRLCYRATECLQVYNNCSCPLGDLPTSLPHNATVTAGMCEVGCLLRYVFIPFCFLVFIGTFMMGTPLTVATLR